MNTLNTNIETLAEIPLPPPLADSLQPFAVRYWRSAADAPFADPVFMQGISELPPDLTNASVVLPQGGETAARDLLANGAARVLFADAAIADTGFIQRMVAALGAERVGVWLPVKRMNVSWGLELTCNADFRCMTPSIGRPSWEVLRSDHTRTSIDADWWARQMLQQGASCVLVSADYTDEQDHTIAAELAEKCNGTLWLSPLTQSAVEWGMEDWHRYGNVSQLVLPPVAEVQEDSV